MKKFRLFYYSALAALTVLIFVFSAACSGGGKPKTDIDITRAEAFITAFTAITPGSAVNPGYVNRYAERIAQELTGIGIQEASAEPDDTDYAVAKINTSVADPSAPAFLVMDTTVNAAERNAYLTELGYEKEDIAAKGYTANPRLVNVVVYFPAAAGRATAPTVLLSAHYDKTPNIPGAGANRNAVNAAAMLETIRLLKDCKPANNILLVFSDGGMRDGLGLLAVRNRFTGFDGAAERVEFAASFSSDGSKGGVILSQTADIGGRTLSEINKITAKVNADSYMTSAAIYNPALGDFGVFAGTPSVAFTNIGGSYASGTVLDSSGKINYKLLTTSAALMSGIIENLGSVSLETLSGNNKYGYFSIFGTGIIGYSDIAAYIMGGAVIAMLGAAVAFAVLKKTYKWKQIGMGAAVMLGGTVLTVGLSYAFYYIITLLLAGFGAINIHAIGAIAFSNAAILITALVLALGISVLVFALGKDLLRKKLFVKVGADDMANANVFIWAITAAVMCFAAPAFSHAFVFTAIALLAVMLVFIFLKDKIKAALSQKTGTDFKLMSLFPYFIPVILTMPVILNAGIMVNMLIGATMLPLLLASFVSLAGFITPYFNLLDGALDRLVKKLPGHTVRIERTVTEKVEDKAKRGKYKEQTVRKIVKEKRANTYSTWMGCTALVLAGVIAVLFSSFWARPNMIISARGESGAFYDSSIVYVIDLDGNHYWQIKDPDIYRSMSGGLSGYKHKPGSGYTKEVTGEKINNVNIDISSTQESGDRPKTVSITKPLRGEGHSVYDLKISSANNTVRYITSIKIIHLGRESEISFGNETEIIIRNLSGEVTLEISTINANASATRFSGSVEYTEYVTNTGNLLEGKGSVSGRQGEGEFEKAAGHAGIKGFSLFGRVVYTRTFSI